MVNFIVQHAVDDILLEDLIKILSAKSEPQEYENIDIEIGENTCMS